MDKAVALIGKNVTAVQGDVSDLDDLDHLYNVVRQAKGHIDIVFANAGVVDPVSLGESTPESYDKHFDLNARGVYFTVQKALPLLADNGSIILSGSAAWQMGIPNYGPYSATKAALVSFVRSWTAELPGRGNRANVSSPGPTETARIGVGSLVISTRNWDSTTKKFRKIWSTCVSWVTLISASSALPRLSKKVPSLARSPLPTEKNVYRPLPAVVAKMVT